MRELTINGEKWVPLDEAKRHFESRVVMSAAPATLIYRNFGRDYEFSVQPVKLDFIARPWFDDIDVSLLGETGHQPCFRPPHYEKVIAEFKVLE